MRRFLQYPSTRLAIAGLSLSVAVVIAFAPSNWGMMMARSFLPQWITLFAAIALLALIRRRWRECVAALCGVSLLAAQVPPGPTHVRGVPVLRLAHLNVLQTNKEHDQVVQRILDMDADVISVQEVDHAWAEVLREGLSGRYPFHVIEPRTNCYGIALFSRIPLDDAHVVMLNASPAIRATARLHGGTVTLYAVHTSSPGSQRHFTARNGQFDLLAHRIHDDHGAVVVIGDLNATPWDRDLERFQTHARLRSNGSMTAPTFPSVAHMALIPIDHVLTSSHIGVVDEHTFHVPGSDHRGLVADIAFAP